MFIQIDNKILSLNKHKYTSTNNMTNHTDEWMRQKYIHKKKINTKNPNRFDLYSNLSVTGLSKFFKLHVYFERFGIFHFYLCFRLCVSHPSWIQVSDFLRFSLVHFRIERIEAISCYQQYLYSHFDWICHFLSKLIWSSNFIAASLTSSSLPSSVRPIQSKRIQNTKAFWYTHRTTL